MFLKFAMDFCRKKETCHFELIFDADLADRDTRKLVLKQMVQIFWHDSDLDLVVAQILATTPEIGERFMIGALTSRGLRVQRWRIRSSILRVDPVGRACRRRRTIFRRQYNVRAPNSLWYVL